MNPKMYRFLAGCIGGSAVSVVNSVLNRSGLTWMRSSAVGTDLILGKSLTKRHGLAPQLVGEMAAMNVGGIWSLLIMPVAGRHMPWVQEGVLLASVSWAIDLAIGARTIPAIQGDLRPADALWHFLEHMVYGLVTTGLYHLWVDRHRITPIGSPHRIRSTNVPAARDSLPTSAATDRYIPADSEFRSRSRDPRFPVKVGGL